MIIKTKCEAFARGQKRDKEVNLFVNMYFENNSNIIIVWTGQNEKS